MNNFEMLRLKFKNNTIKKQKGKIREEYREFNQAINDYLNGVGEKDEILKEGFDLIQAINTMFDLEWSTAQQKKGNLEFRQKINNRTSTGYYKDLIK